MRKSNLLILILGVLLIVGFVTTQAMLKARFKAGKLVNSQVLWDEQHIQRSGENFKVLFLRNIEDAAFEVSDESKVYFQKRYDSLSYIIEPKDDTLFITYKRPENISEFFGNMGPGAQVEIRGPRSLTLICDSSSIYLRPADDKKMEFLRAYLKAGSTLELGREVSSKNQKYLEIDTADIQLSNASLVINDEFTIKSINVNLEGKSILDVKCDSFPNLNFKYSENSRLHLPASILKKIQ